MSKALDPAPLVASAVPTAETLDGLLDSIAAGVAAPMDKCSNCTHMSSQHAGAGACSVDGCDCQAYENADETASFDAVEYEGERGGELAVIGFQIGPRLDERLTAAVRELVGDTTDAAPVVRLRLEELALRSFAPSLTPPIERSTTGSLEWEAILAPEGRLTDDGRAFAPGSIRWRELPLTLMAMLETQEGHDGARVCGRIDRIWRDEVTGLIRAQGVFDDSDFGRNVARMVDEKTLRGNSVDLAIHNYEVGPRSKWFDEDGNWLPQAAVADEDEPTLDEILFDDGGEPVIYVVTDAVIGMSTVCPFPAFADAHIEIGQSVAAAGSPAVWTYHGDGGYRVSLAKSTSPIAFVASAFEKTGAITGDEIARLLEAGYSVTVTTEDGRSVFVVDPPEALSAAATPPEPAAGGTPALLGSSALAPVEPVGTGFGETASGTVALVASVTPPIQPPAAWFSNPELADLTPLTIGEDGRLYGHVAGWGSCHTGYPQECVTPPYSNTDYRFFHLKQVECDDGTLVDVGTITLEAPHANQRLGLVEASAHYDHTGLAAADVIVGEDDHGIWVAGAVRPHLTDEMIRELRGAALSGDWRDYEANLEMIGVLAVNIPGFPIPRVRARVASGVRQSLVAAGIVDRNAPCFDVDATVEARLAALADDGLIGTLAELASDEA